MATTSDFLNSQNPTRPSRQPKESTALLMSVIRSISKSETNEHRDKEKAKLEKEYKKSDQKLDELIASHHESLSAVIQAFGKVSSRLTASREKIRLVKHNLENCKLLLNFRREELKRLWLEEIEHKHALLLLEKIESIKDVPEKVEKFKQKKHYLHATELLASAVNTMKGDLEGIDGLKEVGNELQVKKQNLQNTLVEALHHHVYVCSTSEIYRLLRQDFTRGKLSPFSRQGSGCSSVPTPTKRRDVGVATQATQPDIALTHTYRHQYRMASTPKSPPTLSVLDGRPTEDLFSNPEEDTSHFIAILVECLGLLDKIPDSVEIIKNRMQRELVSIIKRTYQCFAESGMLPQESSQQSTRSNFLREFLELIFEQFHCVAQAHECVLANLRRLAHTHRIQCEVQLYEMAEYWSCVQAVLQMLLGDYLDVANTTLSTQRSSSTFVESSADIASFFSKKRPAKPKRFSLFKFDASSHAISLNSYLKEQQTVFDTDDILNANVKSGESGDKFLVCKPSPRNMMSIFIPVMKFIDEIETALIIPNGSNCALHTFVMDFLHNVIEGQIHEETLTRIEAATKGNDAWKATTDLDTQKALNMTLPLLQSTFQVEKCLQELRDIIQDLPLHAKPFLMMICSFLSNYNDSCIAAYSSIVQSEVGHKRIISATWAKDEDINRLLRSLPNWVNLQTRKGKAEVDIEESPEEVRLRNKQESEMLIQNLAEATIPSHEILSDVSQMRTLALLQESLEWFGGRIRELSSSLATEAHMTSGSTTQEFQLAPEECIKALQQHALEFENLAEICLLVLHLEARVHCFFYLLPVAKQASFSSGVDSQDPDPEVIKLNKDFSNIDEALSVSLQPQKFKYIFEGLGHLIASIMINSAQYIKRMNENGIKKMCRNIFAIQQNLTNITLSREVALDHARHYFELLYHSPEDILNQIVEHGPKFTELEYRNALQLLHRSHPGSDAYELQAQVDRLHDILNEVAVTI